jgi:hypothetical protein
MHRFFNRKRVAALVAAVLLGGGATGVFAYMSAGVTGSTTNTIAVGTPSTVTLTLAPSNTSYVASDTANDCSGTAATSLLPGGCAAFSIMVTNPATAPVTLNSLTLKSWVTSVSGCNSTALPLALTMFSITSPTLPVSIAAGGNADPVLRIQMGNSTTENDSCLAGQTITATIAAA